MHLRCLRPGRRVGRRECDEERCWGRWVGGWKEKEELEKVEEVGG